jgi:hypothetical protein
VARSGGSVASPPILKATSKRLLALLAGGLGLRTILRRRGRPSLSESPAGELKAKLAATKESSVVEPEHVEAEPVEPQHPEQEPLPEGVDERRADTHARARHAIEELRERGE